MQPHWFIEIIGLLGAFINTVSVLPQLIKTFKTRNVESLSLSFISYWFIGCFLLLVYSTVTSPTLPILLNYGLNSFFPLVLILMYLKYKKEK